MRLAFVLFVLLGCSFLFFDSFLEVIRASGDEESQPSYYWKAPMGPTPVGELPKGVSSFLSKSCKACHSAIYNEWQGSLHAHAWTDTIFQTSWALEGKPFFCINCHTPLDKQQANLVTGLEGGDPMKPTFAANPAYDPGLQREGVTCAACHLRNGKVHGPFSDTKAAHPMEEYPLFGKSDFCFQCHELAAPPGVSLKRPMLDTPGEWKTSDYAKEGKTCQSCHMPLVERVVGLGGPKRKSGAHTWKGGHDPETLKSAITASISSSAPGADGNVKSAFTITNSGAGHNFPTAMFSFLEVTLSAVDDKGNVISKKTELIQRLFKTEGTNILGEISDNTLKPKETKTIPFEFLVPAGAIATVKADLKYYFMTEEAFGMLKLPKEIAPQPWVPLLSLSKKV